MLSIGTSRLKQIVRIQIRLLLKEAVWLEFTLLCHLKSLLNALLHCVSQNVPFLEQVK